MQTILSRNTGVKDKISTSTTTTCDDSQSSCALEMNDEVIHTQIRSFLRKEWSKIHPGSSRSAVLTHEPSYS